MRVGVVGASGFLGSHVVAAARTAGVDVRAVVVPRVTHRHEGLLAGPDRSGPGPQAELLDALTAAVMPCDVVVNAAGLARSGSRDRHALTAANVVLPAAVALACRRADVRRLVHVSSAAVQGRRDPLDETDHRSPFSPYSRSKAEVEQWLHDRARDVPDELVVYRPASVHGHGRGITRLLCRVAGGPLVPLAGTGDQPLPVALVENVAAGILFAATSSTVIPVVVQPWEGLTTRRLFELLGARRFMSLPRRSVGRAVVAAARAARFVPRLASSMRSLELLYLGQRVAESSLTGAGFVPPVGLDGWAALVDPSMPGQADPAPTLPRR